VRWSELPPARREIELARRAGITIDDLVSDAEDVPELREAIKLLSPEAKVQLALEWFGDQGHPQPEKRTRPIVATFDGEPLYGDRTPDWGRLPRLEEDEQRAQGQPEATEPIAFSNDRPEIKRGPGPDPAFHEGPVIGRALDALGRTGPMDARACGCRKLGFGGFRGVRGGSWSFLIGRVGGGGGLVSGCGRRLSLLVAAAAA
jgi:hypothetical protein